MAQTVALEIVWRNPKPPQRRQRWEHNLLSGTGQYLIQELVPTSIGSFWTTTSSLQVLPGGRAA
jgi:hypothetical protein